MKRAKVMAACLSVSLVGIVGCVSDVGVRGAMKCPAEINMAGYEQITIETIEGQGGHLLTARLKEALAREHFVILDRETLRKRAEEKVLVDLGQAAPQDGAERKIIKAVVVIKGKVLRHVLSQNVERVQTTQNGRTYTSYRAVGEGIVEVGFDVVDLDTTETIATKSIPAKRGSQTDCFDSPPSLAPEPIFDECYSQVVRNFMRVIAPYNLYFDLTLYKLKNVPANDSGIAMFQIGDYHKAAAEFESALESAKKLPKVTPTQLSKVRHNLGLSHEFDGNYDKAIECFEAAIRMQPEAAYQQSVTRCQTRIRNIEELKKQGVTVPRPA